MRIVVRYKAALGIARAYHTDAAGGMNRVRCATEVDDLLETSRSYALRLIARLH